MLSKLAPKIVFLKHHHCPLLSSERILTDFSCPISSFLTSSKQETTKGPSQLSYAITQIKEIMPPT